jgi:hypothetical protein
MSTKLHEVVPVCNWAPRHEDVVGSGGIATRIFNLGTRWRSLYPRIAVALDVIQFERNLSIYTDVVSIFLITGSTFPEDWNRLFIDRNVHSLLKFTYPVELAAVSLPSAVRHKKCSRKSYLSVYLFLLPTEMDYRLIIVQNTVHCNDSIYVYFSVQPMQVIISTASWIALICTVYLIIRMTFRAPWVLHEVHFKLTKAVKTCRMTRLSASSYTTVVISYVRLFGFRKSCLIYAQAMIRNNKLR